MGGKAKPRRVVVAVDRSAHSERALRYALDAPLLRADDELVLVEVVPPPPPHAPRHPTFVERYRQKLAVSRVEEDMAYFEKLAKDAKVVKKVTTQLLEAPSYSSVGATLVGFAKSNEGKADHIVVGARGATDLGRLFQSAVGLGSVSDYVAHRCECPVTVVPPGKF